MRRRDFIKVIAGSMTAWPLSARAQQLAIPVVGFLHYASQESFSHIVLAFQQGLREAGYFEGQNVAIEYRWANGHYDRLPALADDLVRRQVAVIAAGGSVAAQAAKAATATIPVVFTSGADPVMAGLVASLNRPSGNVTGVAATTAELASKRLEIFRMLMPQAHVIAMLINPNFPGAELELADLEAAARTFGLRVHKVAASNEREIDAAYTTIANTRADGLIIGTDGYFIDQRYQLTALSARLTIPTIYFLRDFTIAGGLMSYAPSLADTYRQAGVYVGRVLKGAKPADLPVVQPTKFDLVINLKAAKSLSVELPPPLLALADEVIE